MGSLLYTLCTTLLNSIISKYPGLLCHFYADNTQIYLSFSPELTSSAFTSIETCIMDIFSWMIGNKLSVNPDKTEYILFNSKNINVPVSINLNLNTILPSECAKNLGVIFQSDMSMDKHISSVVKLVSISFVKFAILEVLSLYLLLLYLQLPLYIPA